MQAQIHSTNASKQESRLRKIAFWFGFSLKYVILLGVALLIWNYLGSGAGKVRFNGLIIGGVITYLAIQEAYFQIARAKINEPLGSLAVELTDLRALHMRIVEAKAYLDLLWKIAVPTKFVALVLGLTLLSGGDANTAFKFGSRIVSWNDIIACSAWFLILVGIDLTWRTFSLFHHIDAFNTKLIVKVKEIAAHQAAAEKFKQADPGENWDEDPSPKGYTRLRLKNL